MSQLGTVPQQRIAKYRADEEMGTPWFTILEPEDFGEAWRNSPLFRQRLEDDIPRGLHPPRPSRNIYLYLPPPQGVSPWGQGFF